MLLGTRSAPNRGQVGSIVLPRIKITTPKSTFGHKMSLQGRTVVRGDRRHLEILAVETIIFVHETGGHSQKQASLALKKGIPKRHAKLNAEKVMYINAKRLPK